ncbi:hypothetical protein Tco_0654769 [Tanacetum coccineum]|uniref:Uncharacterized protein n=1 Tax=Tanacetum coccineum TaxID=301880 RepID=A0ABQ4X482_9ASTR
MIIQSSNVNPLFEENDKDVEIKSSPSFTLTSPEESECGSLSWKDSIHRNWILPVLPPLSSGSNPTSPTLTGEKDKVFKPGILVYHAIHDKNLVTLEKNLRENISSGNLFFLKEPSSPSPPLGNCRSCVVGRILKNLLDMVSQLR